ncbi:MAG: WYL domain-containing protein [Eubacterium sp.]|nr:WYL domain-containing protein [Eubacterium sp.]
MDFLDFSANKGFRLLSMYERLNKGEELNKEQLANEFAISKKTVQRDFEDLRAYLAETHFDEFETAIKYSKARDAYYLVRLEREWLTNKEALAVCKILLESRAFNKEEMTELLQKLMMQISPQDRATAEKIIRSEFFNYLPLQHGKDLLEVIWQLSEYIVGQKVIEFYYSRQDGRRSKRRVKPVSILFNEFYFYLITFGFEVDYPIIFRIDRMEKIKETGEKFDIPYKDKFSDGEFRQRVLYMYGGELKRVKFEYSGVLEAMLDKVPTAKVLSEQNGVYTMTAEAFGQGLDMWLMLQGDKVKIID